MQTKLKPNKLTPGDTVAIVSPSWGGPSVFPDIYKNGLKILAKWGLNLKEFPSVKTSAAELRKNPQLRAEDLNNAFADPEIKAIFASIGGDDSVRILPFLDRDLIIKNPKIFVGYSDSTTVHVYANLLGLVTLHGPSIMAGLSQIDSLPQFYQDHLYEMLFTQKEHYLYKPYFEFCDGYPDWSEPANLGKVKELRPDNGWRWLQGERCIEGQLFGGCIEVLEMLKGTDFWPDRDFWIRRVLFLETSEDKPSVDYVGHVLRNYGMIGIFEKISGLIFCRARDYSDNEKLELERRIVSVIADEFGKPDLPIVANFDAGHTDPQLVLPLGIRVQIDCLKKEIALVESWLK